ncbi:MAG: hypothetical protein J6M34_02005 [Clostridia bacterium]|nr:hypothetical protein [Clostridia bacterium]
MDWKKVGKALLFPPLTLRILLLPVAGAFTVLSMLFLGTKSLVAILSYVLAAYTLTVWCLQIPRLIRFFRQFKTQNPYVQRWQQDANLRVKVALYGSLMGNGAYAVMQLCMGIRHHSFWFYSLAGYYLFLAGMRFFLLRHTRKHRPGERKLGELRKYRACGVVFLLMNIALTLMVFFMVYWNRTFHHHEITTIALAAYTFSAMTVAILNVIRYRKYDSPVYSASKAISLASACVSMLTLESTMLTTFGKATLSLTARRIFLGLSGGVISAFIIVMALFMIIQGTKKIKLIQTTEESHGT